MTETAIKYLYAIPYREKFIIYQPLKRLAFIANPALVNLISSVQSNTSHSDTEESRTALDFLQGIGFFDSDPRETPLPPSAETFKPTMAVLFLTTACNFRCSYCYASAGEKKGRFLPFELGCHAIDIACRNAQELEEDHFTLGFHGGGEPTLASENFRKLIMYARSREIPCKISVATNGYWTDEYRDWILDHLDEISLSFDGIPSVHDIQRPLASGSGSFDGVMKAILAMDGQNFPYGIRMTVTDDGISSLGESIEFICKETRCKTFQVEPVFDHGRAQQHGCAVSNDESFASAFMDAYDVAISNDRHMYYSGARPWVITTRFCQAPEKALVVGADGFITACYEIFGADHPLATEFFYGSLSMDGKMCVNQRDRQRFFEKIHDRRALCEDCFCFWHCAGDCPSKTFTSERDGHLFFGKRCDLNRLITKELLTRYIGAGNGIWQGDKQAGCLVEECHDW